jgi:general secretion pathway protein F/type IV pilus assembly protein PilC
MIFKYNGIEKNGKKTKGTLEALDMDDAKKRLRAKQIFYTSVHEETPSFLDKMAFSRKYKLSNAELATLSRDLSMYLKAGISILNALRLASNQYSQNKKMKSFIDAVTTLLDEGKSFYQAIDTQSIIELPLFYKQSVKVSENSGILQDVLLELAKFLKAQDRIFKQVQNAFAYPAFIIVVSLFAVTFMLAYVVPKITSIFAQMKQELPPITKFVVNVGNFISSEWLILLILLIASIAAFGLLLKFSPRFKFMLDYTMLRMPFFGPITQVSELARFCYISSILLRSGVPFVQTVNLGAKILNNTVLRETFEQASQKVVEGSKFSNALLKSSYAIEKSFIQAIALGEETSEVPIILNNLSDLYFEDNKDKIALFLSMLEPALMLVVGGIIGFIISAMLLPIFSMNIG